MAAPGTEEWRHCLRVWAKGVFPLLISDRLLADAADHLDLNVSWGQVAMGRRI